MKNVFLGKTNYDCLKALLDKLKSNLSLDTRHIFIVPDRMSVLCEKRIFEDLNIESTCNIEVLTLSRLASRVLKNVSIISKLSSCMILQKIIREKKDELKCFNKNIDSDLAETLYGTISQFKSCKVSFNDVSVRTENKILQDKLSDIALLYKAYQDELNKKGLVDGLDRLNFLGDKIESSEYIKNAIIYIGYFDSFTYQGYDIISHIASACQEFNIGVTFSDALNEHIYNKKYLENVLKFIKNPNIIVCKENLDGQFKFLQDNLFCFSPSQMKLNKSDIVLFEGSSFEEELYFAASTIRQMIMQEGYSFNDFNIAMPNLKDKKELIEKVFDKYDFNYFLDIQEDFSKSILVRFLNQAHDLIQENFSVKSILAFIKNRLTGFEDEYIYDFEDYILKYTIDDLYELQASNIINSEFFEKFSVVRERLFKYTNNFREKIKESKTFNDYIDAFKILLEDFDIENKINDLIKKFASQNKLRQVKLFEQYFDSLSELFDNLGNILGQEECDLKTFFITLSSGINSCQISTTPLSIDAIFIGDTSVSFYEKRKILFILDASEGNFPKVTIDCGLISDEDISELSDKYKLEPSIYEINKKERFRAYELTLTPTKELFLSYNFEGKEKSKIYEDISLMFSVQNKSKFDTLKPLKFKDIDYNIKNNTYKVAKSNLIADIRSILDGQKIEKTQVDLLYYSLKKRLSKNFFELFNYKNKLKIENDIYFLKNKTSISQIESFMTCPFLHFARYGLKLREKDESDFDRLNIGNIMHELAYKLLSLNKLPLEKQEIENKAKKIFDLIIDDEKYEGIKLNAQNKILIKNLRQESVRFALALNEQAKHIKFVPTYFEFRFDDNSKIKSLKIKTKKGLISLVGQIDRIDIFKDYFRVIDYKTGKTDTTLKELFFGKKIQLEAYLKVVENSLHLKPAGAYYLPIKGSFSDSESGEFKKYGLKGRTLNDDEVINASDDRFENGEKKSDIVVDIKFSKNEGGERNHYNYSKVIDGKVIGALSDYAINLIQKACFDIESLDITPCPLVINSDDPCKMCRFSALCKFDSSFGNIKRTPIKKIDYKDFIKENDK